ncbi:acyltransferase family protein [Actinomadura fibrosa]|uniref:Acyltransferase family protein n=1 Tax=Actinomadura fibrosa TaxID=111802 RepID=A0ABW2XD99_9ACTN|nr:acyltransferase [Actinomadura fibrosa]
MIDHAGAVAGAGARPARLPSLTGLRAVLALAVVLCHVATVLRPAYGSAAARADAQWAMVLGPAAVSAFFVLSGFVLTWSHRPGDRARAFWRRRFWKIFPAHALAWAVAVACCGLAAVPAAGGAPDRHATAVAAAHLLLVQNWAPGTGVMAFNVPDWSISCEAFFYALFPALVAAVRRTPAARLPRAWAALAAAVLALPLASLPFGGPHLVPGLALNETALWFCYLLPPVRLAEFALGAVTARLVLAGAWPRVPRALTAATPVIAMAATLVLPPQYGLAAAWAPPAALIIADLAGGDARGRHGLLARPAPVALGDASYSLYITHFPLLGLCLHLIGPGRALPPWTAAPIGAGLVLLAQAAALLVHRCYEEPIMRRWSRPRRPAPASRTTPPARPAPARAVPEPGPRLAAAPAAAEEPS